MIAVDSSVIVAGFASWHELHVPALEILNNEPTVVGHAMLESYSVLTRLPAPHRAPTGIVRGFLAERFPQRPLVLEPAKMREFVLDLDRIGIQGGAVYDALIAATAANQSAELVTCDTRAAATYKVVGCRHRMINLVAN